MAVALDWKGEDILLNKCLGRGNKFPFKITCNRTGCNFMALLMVSEKSALTKSGNYVINVNVFSRVIGQKKSAVNYGLCGYRFTPAHHHF